MRRCIFCLIVLAVLPTCRPPVAETPPPPDAANNPAFHDRLREIATSYVAWARVDDEMHWAPGLCRQPQPSRARSSDSGDTDTHGRKLYFVFARQREAYLGRPSTDAAASPGPVGQVLVKESWEVEEVPVTTAYDEHSSPVYYLRQEGHLFHASRRAGLFIMYRLDPATPGTDEGWVYGTVGVDGGVTSAGRVRSCMGCHQDAPRDRLFGIDYQGA